MRRYQIESPEQIIVVHDELDLEPGVLKLKAGGGLAGHNGLRSRSPSTSRRRTTCGCASASASRRARSAAPSHVLSRIPARERELLDVAIAEAADAVELIVAEGIDAAMQDVHGR